MSIRMPPPFMSHEPFLLGVGVVFNLLLIAKHFRSTFSWVSAAFLKCLYFPRSWSDPPIVLLSQWCYWKPCAAGLSHMHDNAGNSQIFQLCFQRSRHFVYGNAVSSKALRLARSWQVLSRGSSGDRITRSCRHTGSRPNSKDRGWKIGSQRAIVAICFGLLGPFQTMMVCTEIKQKNSHRIEKKQFLRHYCFLSQRSCRLSRDRRQLRAGKCMKMQYTVALGSWRRGSPRAVDAFPRSAFAITLLLG